jgi:hypothetical protein
MILAFASLVLFCKVFVDKSEDTSISTTTASTGVLK